MFFSCINTTVEWKANHITNEKESVMAFTRVGVEHCGSFLHLLIYSQIYIFKKSISLRWTVISSYANILNH